MKSFCCSCAAAIAIATYAEAAPQIEAVPWTKSFLETRAAASLQRYSIHRRGERWDHSPSHRAEGMVYVSSSFLPDWEFDVGIQGRSLPTRKLSVRAARQICSDLEYAPLAVMVIADASVAGRARSQAPVYFEMAKNVIDLGIGIGRHLMNRKESYTQAFAFLFGGVGSSKARFMSGEFGIQHVMKQRHFVRMAYQHLRTFGSGRSSFRGMATVPMRVHTMTASYAYRWDSGIEARVSYIHRMLAKSGLQRATSIQGSVSIPIAL